ncbi:hypothetical protein [Streptomyces sp. NRRL F-5630]|uniref:hypothetical protein n=1 Tax=Streptomyces sp. NRRL F-5630 TaxID=1463864 RepID=UPI00131C00BB|nr:hypothetical protein [Streptomyces sp. NRRL F-5630]
MPRLPGQRRRLRSVPASSKPGDGGLDDPLRLGRAMRLRLLAAVRTLLADPSIAGQPHVAQLTSVVLLAKSRAAEGTDDDCVASTWVAQLGSWMGVGESTVHRRGLARLRKSDALHTEEVRDERGYPTGLRCLLMPVWRARGGRAARHPLALNRAELATLLRLCEALFGPGWAATDKKAATPAGLLADRTGRGAASDRLALLLLVLSTPASGWLNLCGGSVRGREGRAAATLARLLSCSAAAARKVLARLEAAGLLERARKQTETQMRGKGRVRILPVARAHGRALTAVPDPVAVEKGRGANPDFSVRPVSAGRDLAPAEAPVPLGASGIGEENEAETPEVPERPAGAEFHTDHAQGVSVVGEVEEVGGFSGGADPGFSPLPERVCAGEEPELGEEAGGLCGSLGAGEGPLRGEQPNTLPIPSQHQQHATAGAGHTRTGSGKVPGSRLPRRRLAQVPELGEALRPVTWLWDRLSGWQQRQIEIAARAELVRLAGLVPLPQDAPRVLAERLEARIAQSRGLVMIRQPYPWLLHRALVQRPACSDTRCDDGISLDTGQPCESCGNVIHIRRAHRARLAAELDQEQPALAAAERQRVLEERLREHTERETEARQRRHAAQRERSHRMRAAARERAAREQEEAAARERVRQALPCGDCGRPDAAGLCEVCGSRRELNNLIEEAGMCQVSWTVNPRHLDEIASVMNQVREDVLARVAASVGELRAALAEDGIVDDPSTPVVAAYRGLRAAQEAAAEYRATALAQLTRTPQAQAEGRYAYAAEQSRSHHRHDPTGPGPAAATHAAERARTRAAEDLLTQRLAHLRAQPLPAQYAPTTERLGEALACVPGGAA